MITHHFRTDFEVVTNHSGAEGSSPCIIYFPQGAILYKYCIPAQKIRDLPYLFMHSFVGK